ncbi:MAG: O-antigen ligase family protein [Candidatus Moranbacteria bacterium]|nr:O-antigen ligase family protein [Candidatus Moranbacteria bacterium]
MKKISKNQMLLIGANILLVLFLIILANSGILPMGAGDFIFFAILTLALALYRPGWAFLFFVGTIMLENINLAPAGMGIAIRPYQFFGGITILALLIRLLTRRLDFELARPSWADYPVLVLVLAGFISAIGSPAANASLKQSIILASFAALYFLTRSFLRTGADIKKAIPFFLGASAVVVAYGIWQNVRFAQGLPDFEVMPGRPNATFTEADWLGMFLVFLLACVYAIIYFLNKEGDDGGSVISNLKFKISNQIQITKFQVIRIFLYLFLAIIYVLLIITVSRSAWLGAAAVTFVFLFSVWTQLKISPKNWHWRETIRLKAVIISTVLLSVIAVYFFHLTAFQLSDRAQSTGTGLQKITVSCQDEKTEFQGMEPISADELERAGCRHIDLEEIEAEKTKGNFVTEAYRVDPNIGIRSVIYKKSWELIKAHPILGIGWGGVGGYLGTDERGTGLNASNIFLETWLGAGLLGLASFVALLSIILIRALRNFMQADSERKAIGLFLILGFFAILVPNLFNSGIMLGYLWLFLGAAFIDNKVKK